MNVVKTSFLCLVTSMAVNSYAKEISAKSVSGEDKSSQVQITQCSFLTGELDAEGPYEGFYSFGVNTKDSNELNNLIRIHKDQVPLKEGLKVRDPRGYDVTYEQGILRAVRVKEDSFGGASDIKTVEMEISADLQIAKSIIATTEVDRLFFSPKVIASMNCKF